MAALCSRLTLCLSTTKHLCWRQKISNIHSIKPFLYKSQLMKSQRTPLGSSSICMFSSQTTPEMSLGSVKKQAEVGFKSGGENYDSNRPSYTDEAVDLIVSEIVSTSKTVPVAGLKYDVLELGAGTGKMTERLSKKLPGNMKYLASDPSENFIDVLKSKGLNVDATIATADSIPLEDRSVGNVVCAQSFHWFAEKENLESIHRVLVPRGKLILVWNMKQFDHDWMPIYFEHRKEAVKKVGGSLKHQVNSMEWRKCVDVSENFKLLSYQSLPGIKIQGDLETILGVVTTISAFNALPVEERNAQIDKLRQSLKNSPEVDINNMTMPFTTELYVYIAQ